MIEHAAAPPAMLVQIAQSAERLAAYIELGGKNHEVILAQLRLMLKRAERLEE